MNLLVRPMYHEATRVLCQGQSVDDHRTVAAVVSPALGNEDVRRGMGRDGGSAVTEGVIVSSLEAVRLLDAMGRGSGALLAVQPLGMLWLHAGAAAGGQNRRSA